MGAPFRLLSPTAEAADLKPVKSGFESQSSQNMKCLGCPDKALDCSRWCKKCGLWVKESQKLRSRAARERIKALRFKRKMLYNFYLLDKGLVDEEIRGLSRLL